MGYRIDPGEPTDVELRRVLREQLGKAAAVLRTPGGPDAEAVHGARKRLKKARSLVRLARADLGPAVARHANAELRRVGADLATQRDADALVEAVDRLREGAADADADADAATVTALDEVRTRLAERAERVRASGAIDRATLVGSARVLDQLAAWIDLVPPKAEGWAAIGPGLAHQHRRARTALAALPEEPSADELHEWRKRVKDLWYHQRLLRRLWPEAQRPLVDAADELASTLGADHDLALLLALLEREPIPDAPTPDAPTPAGATPEGATDRSTADERSVDQPTSDRPAADAPAPDGPAAAAVAAAIEHAGPTATADVHQRAATGPAPSDDAALDQATRALVVAAAEAERARLQARARHLGALLQADRSGAWADRHGAWWAEAVAEAHRIAAADATPDATTGPATTAADDGVDEGPGPEVHDERPAAPDPSGPGATA